MYGKKKMLVGKKTDIKDYIKFKKRTFGFAHILNVVKPKAKAGWGKV